MKLIYWHGWGYDSTFFAPLRKILSSWQTICADEGYFGAPIFPSVSTEIAIGIGHSQGFSRLIQLHPNLTGYVSLNGFTQFMQSQNFVNGIPKPVIGAMIQQFQRKPDDVLGTFYDRAGLNPSLSSNRNNPLLLQNLAALRSLKIGLPNKPILAIAGEADQIAPIALQQDCFTNLHIVKNANHCLIQTHAQECAHLIAHFIKRII